MEKHQASKNSTANTGNTLESSHINDDHSHRDNTQVQRHSPKSIQPTFPRHKSNVTYEQSDNVTADEVDDDSEEFVIQHHEEEDAVEQRNLTSHRDDSDGDDSDEDNDAKEVDDDIDIDKSEEDDDDDDDDDDGNENIGATSHASFIDADTSKELKKNTGNDHVNSNGRDEDSEASIEEKHAVEDVDDSVDGDGAGLPGKAEHVQDSELLYVHRFI